MENEAEVFLNSVPLFAGLTREEKTQVVQALQEEAYQQGDWVIRQVRLSRRSSSVFAAPGGSGACALGLGRPVGVQRKVWEHDTR